jgi:hypothetical protein
VSDSYDLTVYPSILDGHGVNLSGCVSYRYLRTLYLPLSDPGGWENHHYATYSYPISEKVPNSKLILSVKQGGGGWGYGAGVYSPWYAFHISYLGISGADNNIVNITTWGMNRSSNANLPNNPLVYNAGIVNVYEILTKETQSVNNEYSIRIYNGVDWTAFDSSDAIGAMHRKYSISVDSSGWELPLDVHDRENCLIFGDWDSATSSIFYDSTTHRLYAFPGPVSIDIYIFSNTPDLVVGDYGLLMYNASGRLTFSSENPPMCYPNDGFVVDATPKKLPFENNLVQIPTFALRYTTTLSAIHLWNTNLYRTGNRVSLVQGTMRVNIDGPKVGVMQSAIPPGYLIILNRDIYRV